MIDMNPSDVTCVSSALKFVSEHAQRHNIANSIVTFKQPLWWKAFNIIQTEPADSDLRKVILRLGAFHTEMSFLGTIGHLMAGSGLRELLELIYASNAVDIVRYVLYKLSIIIWYISSLVQGCILVKKLCFLVRRTKAKAMESIYQKT